jgi:HPt (histidine-containing phosphotransfer) domain-containing protein
MDRPTDAQEALLDTSALENLQAMSSGDADFLTTLIDTFLEDAPQLLADMRRAVEEEDAAALRLAAHSLKSNSAEFGAMALSALCKDLERQATHLRVKPPSSHPRSEPPSPGAVDWDSAAEKVAQAEALYAPVREALEAMRGGKTREEEPETAIPVTPNAQTAAPTSAPGSTPLDETALQNLRDMVGGETAFLEELIHTYLEDASQLLADMRRAVEEKDAAALRLAAHSLKSNSAEFGALALSALCKDLEMQAKAGDLSGAGEKVAQAEAMYEGVSQALLTELHEEENH